MYRCQAAAHVACHSCSSRLRSIFFPADLCASEPCTLVLPPPLRSSAPDPSFGINQQIGVHYLYRPALAGYPDAAEFVLHGAIPPTTQSESWAGTPWFY